FPGLVRPCLAAEIPGDLARHLPDRNIVASIRRARDRENRFPAQIAGALRHGLNQGGLHVFKHKKRILYISTVRPQLFNPNQASVSPAVSAILSTIRSYPKITRKQLAERVLSKLLGEKATQDTSHEYQQARTALATDFIWLGRAGHIIEFADGTVDLPLAPKPVESTGKPSTAAQQGEPRVAADKERAIDPGESSYTETASLNISPTQEQALVPEPAAGTIIDPAEEELADSEPEKGHVQSSPHADTADPLIGAGEANALDTLEESVDVDEETASAKTEETECATAASHAV
ncbi:MAG: hypothetical protein JOY96_03060, partial [Verrucomicrobia bacterium]|nr:hypothetical protein [Verrucomicrobiota bacterium]